MGRKKRVDVSNWERASDVLIEGRDSAARNHVEWLGKSLKPRRELNKTAPDYNRMCPFGQESREGRK